jgi:drug/metabolite transporter (DMT)-like permease
MLRGGIVIITALFSKIFLKRILYRHNFLGIFLVIFGILLVGGANFIFPASKSSSSASVIYLIII